jgi:uncharacterized membrane protein YgaE (UPF0421/DUF939 family)
VSLAERVRDPVVWTGVSQLVKTAAAAVLAWVLAGHVFGIAQSFLAPWAALLTVNATVYRTFSRGMQQVGAAVLGVVLAFAFGTLFGVNAASFGAMLLLALAAGRSRALRTESTTAAATALVVLLAGYSQDGGVLAARLLDTLIGIAVGLLVNLVVWPPLHDRAAARQVDRIDDQLGELLSAMAGQLRAGGEEPDPRAWVERTRELDHEIDDAWALVRQASESGRLNFRHRAADRVRASKGFGEVLERLEHAVAETSSLARTVARAGPRVEEWDPEFRSTWVDLLARAGAAVTAADTEALAQLRHDMDAAAAALSRSGEVDAVLPVHGALLVNLRNIVDAMEQVAAAQPVRAAAPPGALARRTAARPRDAGPDLRV